MRRLSDCSKERPEARTRMAEESTESEDRTPAERQRGLRDVSKDTLERILVLHRKWLESEGIQGARADLSSTDLKEANLQKAILQKANLSKADLSKTKMQSAQLQFANLQMAEMRESDLRSASLQNADLSA